MDELIEKYAMQCTSWPYWRDMPGDREQPADFIPEWPSYITEEQKTFWRNFIRLLLDDLRKDVSIVESGKLDQILSLLNK
jgi:hypothetical protein